MEFKLARNHIMAVVEEALTVGHYTEREFKKYIIKATPEKKSKVVDGFTGVRIQWWTK